MDNVKHTPQAQTWEDVGDEVSAAVGAALVPVIEKARDDLYGSLLDTVQDYLSENLAFNIASRIRVALREAAIQREKRATAERQRDELLEALNALNQAVDDFWNADPRSREPQIKTLCEAQQRSFAAIAKAEGWA